MGGKIFVISASSGAGKTSLVTEVLKKIGTKHSISRVITYTSRQPRPGDINGIDYHFVTSQEFELKISQDFFIEWSGVYGAYYGSPKHIIDELALGRSFILILDLAGAISVVQKFSQAVSIWIDVPSIEILEQRLVSRGTENIIQIKKRINLAKKEQKDEKKLNFFRHYLINDDFFKATEKMEKLFLNELCK
ncbi:MAG: Guanylate kinase [candidate division TM6 bacterium GW2011_GWF2_32_72]|nr:MAG: Guanylate kinase [candidate division TM6 bacterium GW2011_GWF2_32_72]